LTPLVINHSTDSTYQSVEELGVLIMETKAKIRHRYHVKGQRIKQIARELNVARNTVKKVLQTELPETAYVREVQRLPQLGPYIEELERLLAVSNKLPPKQAYTARRLYSLLAEQGYQGAYDSVQRFVKAWHEKKPLYRGPLISPYILRLARLISLIGVSKQRPLPVKRRPFG
jgi:transposase